MKRYWCTICKRVCRARTLPPNVISASNPVDRIGQCAWHARNESHSEYLRERAIPPKYPTVKKVKSVA